MKHSSGTQQKWVPRSHKLLLRKKGANSALTIYAKKPFLVLIEVNFSLLMIQPILCVVLHHSVIFVTFSDKSKLYFLTAGIFFCCLGFFHAVSVCEQTSHPENGNGQPRFWLIKPKLNEVHLLKLSFRIIEIQHLEQWAISAASIWKWNSVCMAVAFR